jgi:putative ABC transport system permease protein
MVLREGATMTVVGLAVCFLCALGMTRLMANLLFGVSATDPVTFVSVSAVLALVALSACYIPARRATRVDPTVALRFE